jgi:hypothetical protein
MLSSPPSPNRFADDSQFVQQALAKYLRDNHLPHILFYELPLPVQSKILERAQEFKRGEGPLGSDSEFQPGSELSHDWEKTSIQSGDTQFGGATFAYFDNVRARLAPLASRGAQV